QQRLQFVDRGGEIVAGAKNPHFRRHDLLHSNPQRVRLFAAVPGDQRVELLLLTLYEFANEARRKLRVAIGTIAKIGNELADDHSGNDRFSDRISTESIEAVHVPARSLTSRKEAF